MSDTVTAKLVGDETTRFLECRWGCRLFLDKVVRRRKAKG